MRQFKIVFLMIFSAFVLNSCVSSLAVVTDYDKDADFASFKTYYWTDDFQHENATGNEPLFYNTLMKKRMKESIDQEMQGRGYVLDAVNPDLLLDARIIVDQTNTTTMYPSYQPFFWGFYPNSTYQTSTQRKEGSLVIEMIDKKAKQLVWQGYSEDAVDPQAKDKEQEVRDAVTKIFSKYEHRAGY